MSWCDVFPLPIYPLYRITMVKVTKRNTNEKSGRETLRRVAGPTTSQLRESKLSIRTLSSSVALLQETRAMKEERELVQKMQALTVLDPKCKHKPILASLNIHNADAYFSHH